MAGRVTINAGASAVVVTGMDATNATPAYADELLLVRRHTPFTVPAGAAVVVFVTDSASITPTVTDGAGNSLSAVAAPCRSGQPITLGPFSVATGSGISVVNVGSTPGTNAGGGVLYAQAGALKWKGSAGTVTTVAPA